MQHRLLLSAHYCRDTLRWILLVADDYPSPDRQCPIKTFSPNFAVLKYRTALDPVNCCASISCTLPAGSQMQYTHQYPINVAPTACLSSWESLMITMDAPWYKDVLHIGIGQKASCPGRFFDLSEGCHRGIRISFYLTLISRAI